MHDFFPVLDLVALDPKKLRSAYKQDGGFGMPARMCFLHPRAAMQLTLAQNDLGNNLVFSDMWRPMVESLNRKYRGGVVSTITKPPGFSGHNFGLSFDIDTEKTMKLTGLTKRQLDAALAKHGIECHRRDGLLKVEAWHYNCLTPEALSKIGSSSAPAVEWLAGQLYAQTWNPTPSQIQRALNITMHANLKVDGKIGAATRAAVTLFQKKWHLVADGDCGPVTSRVLQMHAAELTFATDKPYITT